MGTTDGYKYKDALRACDVCGVVYHRSELTRIGPLRWACPDDASGLTAEQIARHNASVRPLTIRPVKNPRPPSQTPGYREAEADILNLVLKYAPQQVFLAESGDFGANIDSLTGLDKARTAGWMAFYLGNLVLEGKRPARWLQGATVKLLSLCDAILAHQFMQTTFIPDPLAGGIQPGNLPYGAIYYGDPPLPFSANTLPMDVQGTAVCLLGLLRAFRVSGLTVYRDGARRCATFLRRAQCVGFLVSSWAETDPSGARLQPGPFPETVTWDFGALGPAATSSYRFLPSGIVCAWALSELRTVDGDNIYGDTQANINPNDFALATASSLSASVAACVSWWAAGTPNSSSANTVGFGTSSPQNAYVAFTPIAPVANFWQGPPLLSANWAQGVRALWQIGGFTGQVTSLYNFLRGGVSNAANQAPATWGDDRIRRSLRGTYDPSLCLATTLTATASDSTGVGYDWRTVGLLAPLQAIRDAGSLAAAKNTLSVRLPRRWRMRIGTGGLPVSPSGSLTTVELAQYLRDPDTKDDPRLLTQTGLSMQTSSGVKRSDWAAGGLTNGHYLDLQGAVILADMYRWGPKPDNLMGSV